MVTHQTLNDGIMTGMAYKLLMYATASGLGSLLFRAKRSDLHSDTCKRNHGRLVSMSVLSTDSGFGSLCFLVNEAWPAKLSLVVTVTIENVRA